MSRDDYRKPSLRNWGRDFCFYLGSLTIRGEKVYSTCASAGTSIEVLPFFRVFYPTSHYGGTRKMTVHFGWLAWTVLLFFHRNDEPTTVK